MSGVPTRKVLSSIPKTPSISRVQSLQSTGWNSSACVDWTNKKKGEDSTLKVTLWLMPTSAWPWTKMRCKPSSQLPPAVETSNSATTSTSLSLLPAPWDYIATTITYLPSFWLSSPSSSTSSRQLLLTLMDMIKVSSSLTFFSWKLLSSWFTLPMPSSLISVLASWWLTSLGWTHISVQIYLSQPIKLPCHICCSTLLWASEAHTFWLCLWSSSSWWHCS